LEQARKKFVCGLWFKKEFGFGDAREFPEKPKKIKSFSKEDINA